MIIQFFDTTLEKFIDNLEKPTIAKVLHTIDLLERFGSVLGMPHSKPLGRGLFELRIRGEQEIRILYTFKKQTIILLHGFIKKTQKIAKKDLVVAIKKFKALDSI